MKIRFSIFLILLTAIAGLSVIFVRAENEHLPFTLSPLFQQIGKPVQSANRTITKLMFLSDIDEKMVGDEIEERFKQLYPATDENASVLRYLNVLVNDLTAESRKPFNFRVFLVEGPPNAFALPGGIIGVTQGLLDIVSSESELVSVLSHEIGHIECGHLFDAVRKEMLLKKIQVTNVPDFTSDAIQILGKLLFSKTQENEADEYGFYLLVKKGYDPTAMSVVFNKFRQLHEQEVNLVNDFLSSHPYMTSREHKFLNKAKLWLHSRPGVQTYVGIKNLKNGKARSEICYEDEYTVVKERV